MSTGRLVEVGPVDVRDPEVLALVDALTAELAGGGYTAEETFGYSAEQLAASGVHLVGARGDGALVGIGGVELLDGGLAELKRFYVVPERRGTGVADALMVALLGHATGNGVRALLLETGDQQHAAMRFYTRHGFVEVPRFGPYVESATSVCMRRDLTGGSPSAQTRLLRDVSREVSALLDVWDPIGVYAYEEPPPPGEYDDLVAPLVGRLARGADDADVANVLSGLLRSDYGLEPPADVARFAQRLVAYWRAREEG